MTEQTLAPGAQPEGQTDDASATKTAPRPRRRPSSRNRNAAKLVSPATEAQPTQEETAPAAHAAPLATEAQPAEAAQPPEKAEKPARRSSARPRRGRGTAAQREAQAAEAPTAPEAPTEAPAAEAAIGDALAAQVVPSGAEPATPPQQTLGELMATAPAETIHTVPALTSAPATEPAPTAESAAPAPTSRYRFRRANQPTEAAAAPVRPERLSGWLAGPTEQESPEAQEAAESLPVAAHPAEGIGDLLERLGQREPLPAPIPGGEAHELEHHEEPEEPEEREALDHDEATGHEAETSSGRRRRRRRGRGTSHLASVAAEAETPEQGEFPAAEARRSAASLEPPLSDRFAGAPLQRQPERAPENGYLSPYGPEEEPYTPYLPGGREREQGEWNIATAQQHLREARSPFASPEPAFVRGFGPQPSGVAGPAREFYPRGRARNDRDVDVPPMSANQLGAVITGAIQRQTDRLLTELRHQQHPPSMTVMMPAMPSTERVGVFVDVANVLYSARSLHVGLDFGQLLEFLRGQRRLIRAHAYAPTHPDPNAEQSFLQAVKGLGYRITTKNYKTFASGAKKADMDLDLCMDIVRLVDAGTLDTVVLVSGDSDFLPLLEYCSDHGVRVEVAAFDDSAAAILRQSCDLFINLSLVEDIRL